MFQHSKPVFIYLYRLYGSQSPYKSYIALSLPYASLSSFISDD